MPRQETDNKWKKFLYFVGILINDLALIILYWHCSGILSVNKLPITQRLIDEKLQREVDNTVNSQTLKRTLAL